jgi:hypothetical protein
MKLCVLGHKKSTLNRRTSNLSTGEDFALRPVSREFVGLLIFLTTATGAAYLTILQDNILPSNDILLLEEILLQQNSAAPHYHNDVRSYLNVYFSTR